MHNNQFEIRIEKGVNVESHIHPEPEILYVLDGTMTVGIKDAKYTLGKEDILFVNSSLQHSISADEKTIFCCVKYDYQVLVHVLKKPNSFVICNSAADRMQSYETLRHLCWQLVYHELFSQKKTASVKISLLYQILDELFENFLPDDSNPVISENLDADEKLQTIIHYVHLNYQGGISLTDLARDMYTSTSTLSRLFKKQTGTYFAEYVNQVRIRHAVDELLYTEKNMTKIAMDCGFSNASAFTKVFRETYFMAPTEYRQTMREKVNQPDKTSEQIRLELQEAVKQEIKEHYKDSKEKELQREDKKVTELGEEILVEMDVQKTTPFRKNWNQSINVGSVFDLTKANVQYQLQYLVKELGFTYVRMWSLFSKQIHISDGVTIGKYNFDLLDEVVDFLVSMNVYPWFDLVRRPNANVRSAGDNVWFEDDNIAFDSAEVFQSLFESMLKHFVRRYGMEEVKNWIFEIGQDFFHEDYNLSYRNETRPFIDVYGFAYDKLREIIPGIKVGYTPGPLNLSDRTVIAKYTEILESGRKPDFVASLLFPYIPAESANEHGEHEYTRTFDDGFEVQEITRVRKLMDKCGLGDVPLYISEWNVTISNRNLLNDSCFRGACFCRKMQEMCAQVEGVDMVGMWMASDWISNYFDASSLASGGGGLLNKDRIRKPIYFAMELMNRLGDEIIASGENYIATKKSANEYEIICYNVSWYGPSYFLRSEHETAPENMETDFDKGGPIVLNLELDGMLEDCEYIVKKRTVNSDHGSYLDLWKNFDYSTSMERNDVKYLQEICMPSLGMNRIKAKKDKLRISLPMQPQEVTSLHIFVAD